MALTPYRRADLPISVAAAGELLQRTRVDSLTGSVFSPYPRVGTVRGPYRIVLAGPDGQCTLMPDGTCRARRTGCGTRGVAPRHIGADLVPRVLCADGGSLARAACSLSAAR